MGNKNLSNKLNIKGLKLYKICNILGNKLKFCIMKKNKNAVNNYLENIPPYKTVPHKIWDEENKDSILKLDWNESVIQPTPKVNQAIENMLKKADFFNLYPKTVNGDLLKLLSEYTHIPEENIQYFASSDSAHEYIAKVFVGEGENALILSPSYDNLRLTLQANCARIFYSDINDDFSFDQNKFEKDIKTIKPTFVYIVNPNNPTGNLLKTSYIEKLLQENPETLFLIDEAYYEFAKETCADLVLKYENIIVSRTLSKAFALANFRFGYILASKNNIKNISKIRNPKNITTFSQIAAQAVLSDISYMEDYVQKVNIAKEYFINEIKKFEPDIIAHKSHSNFVLIKLKDFKMKSDLFNYLKENNIFVRNLLHSDILYNCLRITIGTKEQMQKVVSVIDNFMLNINNLADKKSDKLALFDFCGTLVDFQSGNPYIFYVLNKINSPLLNIKDCLRKLKLKFCRLYDKEYLDKNDILKLLKGLNYKDLDKYALEYYINEVRPRIYENVLNKLLELKKCGYKIYLVSAGYEIYLKYFVQEFGLDGLLATKIKFDSNNKCLGIFDGKDCIGNQKVVYIKDILKNEIENASEVLGFTDSPSDLAMLKLCNKKYVVASKMETWMLDNNCEIIYIEGKIENKKIRFYLKDLNKIVKNKRVVLWGASLFLKELLKSETEANPNILGVIDKNPDNWGKMCGNYKIYPPEALNELKPEEVILTIINNNEKIFAELKKEFKEKYPKIKLHKNIFGKCNFMKHCINFCNQKFKEIKSKPILNYVETHVVDHCNLNCKGCSHYCPITPKNFINIKDYEKNLKVLSNKFQIKRFRIMGGEPLLHPEINQFIEITRKYLKDTNISLVTNMTLLDKMDDDFWEAMRTNAINLDISVYPVIKEKYADLINLIKSHKITIGDIHDCYNFVFRFSKKANKDEFEYCPTKSCVNLRKSRLYICPRGCYMDNFNKFFGSKYPEEKGIDIRFNSPKKILKYLNKPSPTCEICLAKEEDWKTSVWEVSKKQEGEYFID